MTDLAGIDAARRVLQQAIVRGDFPCAVVTVAAAGGPLWREAFGHLTDDTDAPAASPETWFDLASLTKPIVTTAVILDLVLRGGLTLDSRVEATIPTWRGDDRRGITLADLLEHASGLPARLPMRPPDTRAEFVQCIVDVPLAHPPRTQALYSDLGFILLGVIAEQVGHAPLDVLFARIVQPVAHQWPVAHALAFRVPEDRREITAPTRPLPDDPRQGLLQGEVHDPYAMTFHGVAGHAGLFGTADAVAAIGSALLRALKDRAVAEGVWSTATTRRATARSTVPGSSRALGWDRMLQTSSCGRYMSAEAFGHVGFTGTSVWVDPVRDRVYVLLTNRVCGNGSIEEMRQVRRAFHEALTST
ncbi:MAG: serine hydrolase domain-containing protein [Vicinamibacterales bacterium]